MSPRIAMAMKVRNEDDILEDNLRFHSAQGIDLFVITDNGSTDRTPEILERYQRAGRAHVIAEPTANMHEVGHEWYTRMARLAASEHGADWIVIADADEFWLPLTGTLRKTLASVPDRYGILIGARAEFAPRPDGPGSFAERLVVRERRALLRPKIAFRADPGAVIWHRGGHDVAYVPSGEDLRSAFRPPGRAVLRGVRDEEEGAGGSEPVPAPLFNARVLHFPVRSEEQFARRIEAAARHEGPDERTGKRARLRKRYEAEGAAGLYSELTLDEEAVEAGIREGALVRDTRLRDYLALVGDPLADGPADPPDAPAMPPEELERERAELELDAMATLTRHQRLTEVRLASAREKLLAADWRAIEREAKRQTAKADRRLERVEKLQGKVRRLRAELRRERRRPWTRLRRAVTRR